MSSTATSPQILPRTVQLESPHTATQPSFTARRRIARWLGPFQIDVRSLAAMRIVLGLTTIYELIYRMQLVSTYYTNAGVSPHRTTGFTTSNVTLFALSGSYAWAMIVFSLHLVTATLFTIGYRTRLMTVLLAALLYSMINRNVTLTHAGSSLELWLLIWSTFLPLGASASIDARLARYDRHADRFRRVCALPAAAALCQMVFVYWSAVSAKGDDIWTTQFTALHFYLQSHLSTPLGYLLAGHTGVTQVVTMSTLVVESILPVVALLSYPLPRLRTAIVFIFIGFHLSILATIYVSTFSFVCIAGWLLFMPAHCWDFVQRRWLGRQAVVGWCRSCQATASVLARFRGDRGTSDPRRATRSPRHVGNLNKSVSATVPLAALFAYVVLVNLAYDLPVSLSRHAAVLNRLPRLKQNWEVMAGKLPAFTRLGIDITLANGTTHRLTADEPSVDGAFWWTLPRSGTTRESYFRPRIIPLESGPLVAFRGMLLAQATAGDLRGVADFCDFHRRCWDEHHPDPREKVVEVAAKYIYDTIPDPDDLSAKRKTAGEVTIYGWPANSASARKVVDLSAGRAPRPASR